MSNVVKPFGSIERALRQFLLTNLPGSTGRVGSELKFTRGSGWYVRIDKVDSSSDRFEGEFIVDVEVFADNYLEAESRSLDAEALLLGYPHVVEVGDKTWVFDEVSQNSGPDELPWEDDEVHRLGATYVITARRR